MFTCYCGFETDDIHEASIHERYPDYQLHGLPERGKFEILMEGFYNPNRCFVCGKPAVIKRFHGQGGWTESYVCLEHINKRAKPEQQNSSAYMPFIRACMKK